MPIQCGAALLSHELSFPEQLYLLPCPFRNCCRLQTGGVLLAHFHETSTSPCGVGTLPLAQVKSQTCGRMAMVLNPGEAGVTPRMRCDICTSGVEHQPWLKSPPFHISRNDCVSGTICQRRICAVPYLSNSPAWSIA